MARVYKNRLPVGIDNFEKLRKNGFYYVDKTGLIIDLLDNWSEVTLLTRPRRFGKTLNLSMLEQFFSTDTDKSVFEGLKVTGEAGLCEKYMGMYPVISLSLKGLEGGSYASTYSLMVQLINRAAVEVYRKVRHSEELLPIEMESLKVLMRSDMSEADLMGSLYTLSRILESHYGSKVIILIDEYDVPLARACEDGYYEQMVRLIRNLFHQALKTNSSLHMAVLSGCMRISKESIFTGMNNLKVRSIMDEEFDEYFGFTDTEVKEMLTYYGLEEYYSAAKEWYDGYTFGQVPVYCPWDVICYCDKLRTDSCHEPENFWTNSSGNGIVRKLIEYNSGNESVKGEIERLINGEAVEKTIRQDLTYPEIYTSIDNIWSVLYTTGYLTLKERVRGNRLRLVVPNMEVKSIFAEKILEMFEKDVKSDGETMRRLCNAFRDGDTALIEGCLNDFLRRTISIRDTAVRNALKENFYHGLLVGILSGRNNWRVESNRESGEGYSDIIVRDWDSSFAMVIEVKYAEDGDLNEASEGALRQIEEKRYAGPLYDEKRDPVLKYGIAFHLKEVKAVLGEPVKPG